ncbi:MAG TPA: hypothetical protein VJ577_05475 [Burkholderiaceae bacterium]|nr:hypothetical protein [Burkholderiaceae bacterium]
MQDAESALFLVPLNGDVGYTPWAHEAGRFDELAEAMDTAQFILSGQFFITEVSGCIE